METEEKETIEYMLGGIIHNADTWEVLLPDFLKELTKYNEAQRKRIINDVMNVAIEELPQENYEIFVKRVITSIVKLLEDVRYAVLTSSIVSPEGFSEEKIEKVHIGLSNIIKQIIAQKDKNMYEIMKAIIEAMVIMNYDDGMIVMRAIVSNTLKFSRTEYMSYATSWLNVAGEMDGASLKKLLKMRKEAISEIAPKRQLINNDILTKVAMLIITGEKRRRILDAVENLDK